MKRTKSIKVIIVLFLALLSFDAQSQYGVIEMKNGEQFEMVTDDLIIERDSLRYFKEKWKRKASIMGFGAKKLKQEYLDKSNLVSISEIKKIHVRGELSVGNKLIYNYIGIRYIKVNRGYDKYFVVEDGKCSLLVKSGDGNAIFSIYVQKGNEDPFELHRSGTGFGPKFKRKSEEYFAGCAPAIEFMQNDLERSALPKVVEIYNANCVE